MATSDTLLIGSLPFTSAEEALRAAAAELGGHLLAIPDGETRSPYWIQHDKVAVFRALGDTVEPVPGQAGPGGGQLPHQAPGYRIRRSAGPRWAAPLAAMAWPRIDDAIESYPVFSKLKAEGVIPADIRAQVGLPPAFSVLGSIFKERAAYHEAEEAFLAMAGREIARLAEAIPPAELAIQVDACLEVLDGEHEFPGWEADSDGQARDRFAGPFTAMAGHVPPGALLGLHLCYGTWPEWPMFEARDMGLVVDMANDAVARAARAVDWLHLPGPRPLRSENPRFWQPLSNLEPGSARVYLGIVLPGDGVEGVRQRARAAREHGGLATFGVAAPCGFGRQAGGYGLPPGASGGELFAAYSRVVRDYLNGVPR